MSIVAAVGDYGVLLALLAGAGLASGFAGGLFGIGGGIVSVPALYFVFQAVGADDAISLKVALGSSLAVVIVTSWRALHTHGKVGNVDYQMLRFWAPWLAGGAAVGGLFSRYAPGEALSLIFAGGAMFIGWRRLARGTGDREPRRHVDLSASGIFRPVAVGTGFFCALMGIGGGAVGLMAMTMAGRSTHQAIATASGIGMAVAAPGALGFLVSGLGVVGAPPFSLGYVNLPAFGVMGALSAIAAPMGARLSHRLSGVLLSRLFGGYALFAAGVILWDMFVA